jgi:hypothetical protein
MIDIAVEQVAATRIGVLGFGIGADRLPPDRFRKPHDRKIPIAFSRAIGSEFHGGEVVCTACEQPVGRKRDCASGILLAFSGWRDLVVEYGNCTLDLAFYNMPIRQQETIAN